MEHARKISSFHSPGDESIRMPKRLPAKSIQELEPVRQVPLRVRDKAIPAPDAPQAKPKPDRYEDWVDKQW